MIIKTLMRQRAVSLDLKDIHHQTFFIKVQSPIRLSNIFSELRLIIVILRQNGHKFMSYYRDVQISPGAPTIGPGWVGTVHWSVKIFSPGGNSIPTILAIIQNKINRLYQ